MGGGEAGEKACSKWKYRKMREARRGEAKGRESERLRLAAQAESESESE